MIRERAPNLLLQALVRGSNGVGYTGYPDNVVSQFIHEAARGGVDLFRVFGLSQLGRQHACID